MNTYCERNPHHPSSVGLASKLYKEVFLPFGSKNPRPSGAGFFNRFALKMWVLSGWLILFLSVSAGAAFGNHQVDRIEAALSDEVGGRVAPRLGEVLSEEDRAYGYFLLAVYRHDPAARDKAEEIYARLNTPDSRAFLGSIGLLKARDSKGGLFSLLKRKRLAQKGIDKLDAAAEADPDDPKVRIVRAISYLGLPALFGKFEEGFTDIKKVLRQIDEGTLSVPEEEPFFRDRASLYYYAGRYYLRKGEKEKAKDLFSKASGSTFHTPFAAAAKKRMAAISSSP